LSVVLSISDPHAAENVLARTRQYFSSLKFDFANPTSQVQILSGQKEASDMWIALNYILDNFKVATAQFSCANLNQKLMVLAHV
jgi:hypothetical protein